MREEKDAEHSLDSRFQIPETAGKEADKFCKSEVKVCEGKSVPQK